MVTPVAQFVLVARPGPLADGLMAVMLATEGVAVACAVEDPSASPPAPAAHDAAGVLVEGTGYDVAAVRALLESIRSLCPSACSIFLADDVEQEAAASEAGADVVLLKGTHPADLASVLERVVRARA